nr:hypothetical protein [Tanacetum cinerariifolium]
MNEYKGRMHTKIELALEQSQQGVSNDVLEAISGDGGGVVTRYAGCGGGVAADSSVSNGSDSTVTYTAVSSPFRGFSDIRSRGVDGPPVMSEDPYAYVVAAFQDSPSPDYVSGPEHPPSPVYVLEFIPEPVYPKFMPSKDDILPVEEEPLPAAASPTTESPGYIDESDPDEDPEEDPADYPADEGDEGDDEDESFDDDEDEDIDNKGMRRRMST